MKINYSILHVKTFFMKILFTIFFILIGCSSSGIKIKEIPKTANAAQEVQYLNDDMNTAALSQMNFLSNNDFKEATKNLENAKKELSEQKKTEVILHSVATGRAYLKRAQEVVILGHAKNMITQAVSEGAKKFAPRNLAVAENNYKEMDTYMAENRYDSSQIKFRSQIVNQSADHLVKITQDSKNIHKMSSEELALQIESTQNQIAEKQKDLIVKQDVTASLAAENRNLENEIFEKQKDLTEKQSRSEALIEKNKALELEKKFNDKFEKARQEFTEKEAEVYRQGDTLAIRLRGLGFPSSQAVLSKSNFPLLAKVQKVIKELGGSFVVVEGHADSTGSKAINTKVAEERAQTVKDYFVSNGIIAKEKIKAIGFRDEKPLATNKTAVGRAQNRRVDVVVMIDKNQKLLNKF